MKILSLVIVVAFVLSYTGFAQEEKEIFLIKKEIKHLPVISQGRTGTGRPPGTPGWHRPGCAARPADRYAHPYAGRSGSCPGIRLRPAGSG